MPEGDSTNSTQSAHLKKLAKRGDKTAQSAIVSPKYPAWIAYMREHARNLHGRSGVGQFGIAPLSYANIESYQRLKRVEFQPYEVDGLCLLDSAMLYPGDK